MRWGERGDVRPLLPIRQAKRLRIDRFVDERDAQGVINRPVLVVDDADCNVRRLVDREVSGISTCLATGTQQIQLGERLTWRREHYDEYRCSYRED